MILAKLILAHLIGDFFLQTKKGIDNKEQKKWKSPYLFFHVAVHFALILIILWDISVWPAALLIGVTHFFIDGIKLSFQKQNNRGWWFGADQAAHVIILVFVWHYFWNGFEIPPVGEHVWIIGIGILFLTRPASMIMQRLLSRWSNEVLTDNDSSLDGAGQYIGMLERMFVYIAVLSGSMQVIGFLLAAKSVFRFGDLTRAKDRKLTEYILVGTLLSFLLAIVTGLATVHFLIG